MQRRWGCSKDERKKTGLGQRGSRVVTQQMNWDWRVTEAEMNISFGGNEESQRRVKQMYPACRSVNSSSWPAPRVQLSYFSSKSTGKEGAPIPVRDTARTGLRVLQDFNMAFSLLPCPSSRLELSYGRVASRGK